MQYEGPITTTESTSEGRMKVDAGKTKKKMLKKIIKDGEGGPGGMPSIGYKKSTYTAKPFTMASKAKKTKLPKISSSSLIKSILKRSKSSSLKGTKSIKFKTPKLKSIKLKKLRKSIKSAF